MLPADFFMFSEKSSFKATTTYTHVVKKSKKMCEKSNILNAECTHGWCQNVSFVIYVTLILFKYILCKPTETEKVAANAADNTTISQHPAAISYTTETSNSGLRVYQGILPVRLHQRDTGTHINTYCFYNNHITGCLML